MALPALAIEGAEVLGPKVAQYGPQVAAFFARYKTLPYSVVQRIKNVWQSHPTISNILSTGGTTAAITYMTDEATKGNPDIIQAINDSAAAGGLPGIDLGNTASSSMLVTRSIGGQTAGVVIGNAISELDDRSISEFKQDDPAFAQELALKQLMLWARREVSVDPARIKEFHQNMRLFLNLPTGVLNKAIEVHLR